MSDLKTQFETAVADSKNLPERPDNQTMLKMYGLVQASNQRRCQRLTARIYRHGRVARSGMPGTRSRERRPTTR